MTTLVKICGVTTLDDAQLAVEAGADYLGFNFYKGSSRYIAPLDARRIIAQLPKSVISVGVFVNQETPLDVTRLAEQAQVQAVQLHGSETPAYCQSVNHPFVIKALRVGDAWQPEEMARYKVDAVLLDAYHRSAFGGTGQVFDWSVAERAGGLVSKLFLAGGLIPSNVAEAIRRVRPFAVDVCSGVEVEPGRKDAKRVQSFVREVRAAAVEMKLTDEP